MNSYASVVENAIPVEHTECDGTHWLKIQCPGGWDEVKKYTKKILKFENRTYAWRSWNSDYNYCTFRESGQFAKF